MKRILCTIAALIVIAPWVQAGDAATKQTITYVQKLQTPGGGFIAQLSKGDAKVLPTLRATSAAVRALHYLGGDITDKAACIKFVESCHDPETGGFADMPKGKPDVFTTAVGVMAVTELKMPVDKYGPGAIKFMTEHAKSFDEIRIGVAGLERLGAKSPKAEEWRREVGKGMKRNGTFGDGAGVARETGSRVVTLLRLGEKATLPDIVIKTLNEGQRQNGGWGKADDPVASDLETTYRVMRCYMMLKARPGHVEGVRSFVAKCRNEDSGYGIAPGQPSSVNGTYFAAIVTHWLKEAK